MGRGIKSSRIYRRFKRITPTGTVGIITVFILLVSIMVGYSMVDDTLNINGRSTVSTTTLIRISSLKVKDAIGGSDNKATIEGNIKGVLETIFTEPGTVTFEGTVVNMGSSEAILSTINLINESNNSSPTCITMSIDGLKVGDKLTPSQEQKFTIKVTSTCTGASSKNNEFSLSYIPVNASEGSTTIEERLQNIENRLSTILDVTYPVGSIYMSTSETSPETLFGGEWEQIKDDAYLKIVSKNPGTLDGTSKEHVIPIESMPAHNHHMPGFVIRWTGGVPGITATYINAEMLEGVVQGNKPYATNTYSDNSGSSEPYYPYYYGVYLWKRTV